VKRLLGSLQGSYRFHTRFLTQPNLFWVNPLNVKETLAFIGILALAVSLWFLRGQSDSEVVKSKNETVQALQGTIQSKEDIIAKDNALIAFYQGQAGVLSKGNDGGEVVESEKVYPDDDGFDAQDLGSGFSAYQVFGPIKNPNNNKFPDKIPNHTPWKFGDGNSGIAANHSGLYVSNATNRDHNGATSTNGQAGFLEYKGSSISQLVELPEGTYSVTFDYEARRDYTPANQIAVSIDGTVLFIGAPTDYNNFKQITTRPIILKTPGLHELKFLALGSVDNISAYPCTFIDNVSLNHIVSRISRSTKGNADPENVPSDSAVPTLKSFKGATASQE
jgi:hypothetical protein